MIVPNSINQAVNFDNFLVSDAASADHIWQISFPDHKTSSRRWIPGPADTSRKCAKQKALQPLHLPQEQTSCPPWKYFLFPSSFSILMTSGGWALAPSTQPTNAVHFCYKCRLWRAEVRLMHLRVCSVSEMRLGSRRGCTESLRKSAPSSLNAVPHYRSIRYVCVD